MSKRNSVAQRKDEDYFHRGLGECTRILQLEIVHRIYWGRGLRGEGGGLPSGLREAKGAGRRLCFISTGASPPRT